MVLVDDVVHTVICPPGTYDDVHHIVGRRFVTVVTCVVTSLCKAAPGFMTSYTSESYDRCP